YLFFCPLGAACCVGLFCAIVIFFNLRTAALRNNPTMTDYRTFSLGASFFTIYFSTTWVLGFLTYFRLDLDFSFYTFFQILNGLMTLDWTKPPPGYFLLDKIPSNFPLDTILLDKDL
ncbi:putative GPCR family 2 secretin-like, partial [Homarus americanus]